MIHVGEHFAYVLLYEFYSFECSQFILSNEVIWA